MELSRKDFQFLFNSMMDRAPSDGETDTLFAATRGQASEAVSLLCVQPEFVMKHPAFTPKPMTDALKPVNVNGIDLLVPSNDWVHWGTLQGWGYEKWVADAMRSILKPGSVFADVGANTGVLTMLGASLVGDAGQVYAIEASIENAAVILANTRHVGATNTVILPVAVTDKKGIELISVDFGGSNKFVVTEAIDSRKFKFEPIATDTLDSLLSHLPRLDLIKIDIEGREGSALRGGRDLIARTRPRIIGEYHANSPEAWYADELVAQNYTMAELSREGGMVELGSSLDALHAAAAARFQAQGTCLEVLFTPAS